MHPCINYKKDPGYAWKEEMQDAAMSGATGWAIHFNPDDTPRVIVLDVDTRGLSLEEVTKDVDPTGKCKDIPTVRTPSGGWHLYFAPPEGKQAVKMPTTFTLGDKIKGDVRSSVTGSALILLPGSLAVNKEGDIASYDLVRGSFDVLPELPKGVFSRLKAADNPAAQRKSNDFPTEVYKLRELLNHIPPKSVVDGTWGNDAYSVGIICGRICGYDKPPSDWVDSMYRLMETKLDGEPDKNSWVTQFGSGWSKGRDRGEEVAPVPTKPSETEVITEFGALFGTHPELEELLDTTGKRQSYVLILGNQRRKMQNLGDMTEVVGAFGSMCPSLDPDMVSRSPLCTNPGWYRVLKLYLQRTIRRSSLEGSIEEELQGKIDQAIRDAAQAGRIGTTQRAAYSSDSQSDLWIQRKSLGKSYLCATPTGAKYLLIQLPPEATSLWREWAVSKRDASGKIWKYTIEDANLLDLIEHHYSTNLDK